MNAIVISENEFLVDNRGNKGLVQVDGEIVIVYPNKKLSIPRAEGGFTENVPNFGFPGERFWEEASKKHPIINLESNQELFAHFNKVCEGHSGRFYE
jgi:hypothetical protein